MSQANDRDCGVNDDRIRELSNKQNRTFDESYELARLHLLGAAVEDADRALEILDPLIGKTTTSRQFRKLAELIGRAYVDKRQLALAREWLQYVDLDDAAARKLYREVCIELFFREVAARANRRLVAQHESATTPSSR